MFKNNITVPDKHGHGVIELDDQTTKRQLEHLLFEVARLNRLVERLCERLAPDFLAEERLSNEAGATTGEP